MTWHDQLISGPFNAGDVPVICHIELWQLNAVGVARKNEAWVTYLHSCGCSWQCHLCFMGPALGYVAIRLLFAQIKMFCDSFKLSFGPSVGTYEGQNGEVLWLVFLEARRFSEWQVSARPVSTCHDHLTPWNSHEKSLPRFGRSKQPFQLCTNRISEGFVSSSWKMGKVRRLRLGILGACRSKQNRQPPFRNWRKRFRPAWQWRCLECKEVESDTWIARCSSHCIERRCAKVFQEEPPEKLKGGVELKYH